MFALFLSVKYFQFNSMINSALLQNLEQNADNGLKPDVVKSGFGSGIKKWMKVCLHPFYIKHR